MWIWHPDLRKFPQEQNNKNTFELLYEQLGRFVCFKRRWGWTLNDKVEGKESQDQAFSVDDWNE